MAGPQKDRVQSARGAGKWDVITSRQAYSSSYLKVYRDKVGVSGYTMTYDWFSAPDFCVVLPVVGSRLLAIRNYRYPADDWFIEFPAGHIEQGESAEQACRRELLEETGYNAQVLKFLQWYYPTSRSTQKAYVFFAKASKAGRPSREPSELQRVTLVGRDTFEDWLRDGRVRHAASIVAYSLAMLGHLLD